MYLAYYGLAEKPFQISPDPRFLWLGENHQEALAAMKYSVLSNQGFLLLTGDVGTGKTTLINALVRSLGSDTLAATVFHPRLEAIEFMNTVARAFTHSDGKFTGRLDFITWFTGFLKNAQDGGLKVLLIIDEAQTLALDLLEEIRLLSNIERPESKLLNVFFVGQNEFNDILRSEQCKALRQRITNNYNIRPLTRDETKDYIHHRLRVAGAKREIFTGAAIKEVYAFSHGYPRLTNVICDRALLTGYVRETETISPAVVKECARELTLPGESRDETPEKRGDLEKRRSGFARLWSRALFAALLAALALLIYSLLVFGSWQGLWAGLREYSSRVQTRIEQYLGASRSQAYDREKYGKIPDAPAAIWPSPDTHGSPPPLEGSNSTASLPNPSRAKAAVE